MEFKRGVDQVSRLLSSDKLKWTLDGSMVFLALGLTPFYRKGERNPSRDGRNQLTLPINFSAMVKADSGGSQCNIAMKTCSRMSPGKVPEGLFCFLSLDESVCSNFIMSLLSLP